VGGVKAVQIQLAGGASRAANAGDDDHLIQIQLQFLKRAHKTSEHRPQSTSGTPNVRQPILAQQAVHRVMLGNHHIG
jgi:hypothetical protein